MKSFWKFSGLVLWGIKNLLYLIVLAISLEVVPLGELFFPGNAFLEEHRVSHSFS